MKPVFFTIPKAFQGHIGDIQINAIRSWLLVEPKPRVILFGDDEGVGEAASRIGAEWIPSVRRSELGTPLLGDVFRQVLELGNHECLVYLNADIICPQDFLDKQLAFSIPSFMATGRRTTLEIEGSLSECDIRQLIRQAGGKGRLDPPHALDYFALYGCPEAARIPDFCVGRPGWDNWMIFNILSLGIPVIDLTHAVRVIHQHHDYRHVPAGRGNTWEGPEADLNRQLAGAKQRLRFSIADATHISRADGTLRPNSHTIARYLKLLIAKNPSLKWLVEILGFPFLVVERRRRRNMKKLNFKKS